MYYIYGQSGPSLLIESTDSMILFVMSTLLSYRTEINITLYIAAMASIVSTKIKERQNMEYVRSHQKESRKLDFICISRLYVEDDHVSVKYNYAKDCTMYVHVHVNVHTSTANVQCHNTCIIMILFSHAQCKCIMYMYMCMNIPTFSYRDPRIHYTIPGASASTDSCPW